MRLRTKIMALLAVPVILLIALVGVAFRAERNTTQSLGLVEHSYQVKEVLGLVFDDLVSAETGMRGYLLTGKEEFLTPYTDGTAALRNDYARLTYLTRGDAGPGPAAERPAPALVGTDQGPRTVAALRTHHQGARPRRSGADPRGRPGHHGRGALDPERDDRRRVPATGRPAAGARGVQTPGVPRRGRRPPGRRVARAGERVPVHAPPRPPALRHRAQRRTDGGEPPAAGPRGRAGRDRPPVPRVVRERRAHRGAAGRPPARRRHRPAHPPEQPPRLHADRGAPTADRARTREPVARSSSSTSTV